MAFNDSVMNRNTSNVLLPIEVSSEIWSKTIEESAIMQLSRQISLPGAGMEFQTITGEPEADWVEELGSKPISNHTLGTKQMKGYTIAVILPFSNQFRRDKEQLYQEMVSRAPKAIGTKLDKTVFGGGKKPGELFDTMAGVTEVDITDGIWDGLVTADAAIAAADGILDGFAISPQFKSKLLTAKDAQGRPLYINSFTADSNVPNLMGHPTYVKKGVYQATANTDGKAQLGFAGDWTSAMYGVVEGITTSISDQATLTIDGEQVDLWSHNMFAVRFEAEIGFRMKDDAHFVKFVG